MPTTQTPLRWGTVTGGAAASGPHLPGPSRPGKPHHICIGFLISQPGGPEHPKISQKSMLSDSGKAIGF